MNLSRYFSLLLVIVSAMALFFVSCDCGDDDPSTSSGQATEDDDDAVDDDDDDDDNDDDDDDDDDNDDNDTGDKCVPNEFIDEPIVDQNGIVWNVVPAGCTPLGSYENEIGRREDEAQHEVTLLGDFAVMETETTQELFESIMGYNPSFFPSYWENPYLPVEMVSWYDALAFADKLSAAQGFDPCYTLTDIVCADETAGNDTDYCKDNGGIFEAEVAVAGGDSVYECEGFRLPTEAEWEYAARAGHTTPFYNGAINHTACTPVDPTLDAIGWYCGNSNNITHPVGGKQPNRWGLYDMTGNVLEWTWDWYAADNGGDATDPVGPEQGHFKVARGGSARFDGALRCRNAFRAGRSPNYRDRFIGVRLVRSVDPAAKREPTATKARAPERKFFKAEFDYPDSLPFEFTRPDVGTPLTQQEIDAFTTKITSFWSEVEYFHWVLWHSHGMDASNPDGMRDYKIWWQDTRGIKSGEVVTFEHFGGADNVMIRTPKVLNNAIAGYLSSGDETMGRVVEQYAKGITAFFLGMQWTEEDPEEFIMPRGIFTQDHSYTEDGREAYVDYEPVRNHVESWNAHTINNPVNPYWGDIWIRNMRSKDDVPHIYRSVPALMRIVEVGGKDEIVDAAAEALYYLHGFGKDIADSGYYIRTKDMWGNPYLPMEESGIIKDLASFVQYDQFAAKAECNGELASALIGYGDNLDVNCGNGIGALYEVVATVKHYFNWDIIRYFHTSAITNALMVGEDDIAYALMEGLAQRMDEMTAHKYDFKDDPSWDSDVASYALVAATAGLPLTSAEARLVMEQYSLSVDFYEIWPYWDLWDESVPDGTYSYIPGRDISATERAARAEEMAYFLEYCWSPFKNETGAEMVDCDIILDPSRWGN